MPWTQKDYEDATALVGDSKLPKEKVAALRKKIGEYQAANPTDRSGATTLPETTIGVDPSNAAIAGMPIPAGTAPGMPVGAPVSSAEEEVPPEVALQRERAFKEATFDNKLPTASKRRDVAYVRDPEYMAPTDPGNDPRNHPIQSALSFLPHYLGGNVEQWHEPSEEEYRRSGFKGSLADYRDLSWVDAFDRAKNEGRSIVRHDYANHPTWQSRVASTLDDVKQKELAAVHGFQAGTTFGIPVALASSMSRKVLGEDVTEDMKQAADNNPKTAMAANLFGAALPQSLAGRAGSVGAGLAEGVAGRAGIDLGKSALGRMGVDAIEGATGGAAQSLGENATAAASGERDVHLGEAAKDAAKMIGLGGSMGFLGGGIRELAEGGKGLVRERMPEVKDMERPVGPAGEGVGKTSVISGVTPTETGQAAINEARAARLKERGPQKLAASQLEGPMVADARVETGQAKAATKATDDAFKAANEGNGRSVGKAVEYVSNAYQEMLDAEGKPVLMGAGQAKQLQKQLNEMVNVKVATSRSEGTEMLRQAQAANPEAKLVSGTDAAKMGLDIAAHAPADVTPEKGWYVVIPKKYNPRQLDNALEGIANALKATKGGDAKLEGLQRAAMDIRDTYPNAPEILGAQEAYIVDPTTGAVRKLEGYSAFKHNAHLAAGARERQLGMAGLPKSPEADLTADQAKAFLGGAERYGTHGRLPEEDAALRARAARTGQTDKLESIGGFNAMDDLREKARLSHALSIHGQARRLDPLLLRLDPGLRVLAAAPGGAAGGSAARVLGAPGLQLNPILMRLLPPKGQQAQ